MARYGARYFFNLGKHAVGLEDPYYPRTVHLSDFIDGKEHKVLGHGELPIKDLLLELKSDGYEHSITLELDFDNPERNIVESNEEAVALMFDDFYLQRYNES